MSRPADLLFPQRLTAQAEKRCIEPPIGCGKPINFADFVDDLSRQEYQISNLCQECQDKVFGIPMEEDEP